MVESLFNNIIVKYFPANVVILLTLFIFFFTTIYNFQKHKKTIIKYSKSRLLFRNIVGTLILTLVSFIVIIYLNFKLEKSQSGTPSPVPTATMAAALPTAIPFAAGESMNYGRYPQSNNYPSSISWNILSVHENQLLLISQEVLDAHYFGTTNQWRQSELRDWLNGEFLNNAFTSEEQLALCRNGLDDLVTIPSIEDVGLLRIKTAKATQRAKDNGASSTTGNSAYITQTPHDEEFINYIGADGKTVYMSPDSVCGVRPMIMLDATMINITNGHGTTSDPWIAQPSTNP